MSHTGVGGIVEHPDEPSESSYPSIWRLPFFSRVLKHPQARAVRFAQGPLGQASKKPTRFLAINCGHIKQYIDILSSASARPGGLTTILDKSGEFSTSKLKTYPPRCNGAILLAFAHTALASRSGESSVEFSQIMFAAIDSIVLHCDRIADEASSLVFHDHQPSLAESHPLHAFIQWPNRQAGRGRDFSSAHTSLQAMV